MKSWIQHHLNPTHIYCRLVGLIGKSLAKKVSIKYETLVWELLY